MYVKIIKRPEGEAPEWVREAWIGLRLPTLMDSPREFFGFGVLAVPQSLFRQVLHLATGKTLKVRGYPINASIAVEILSSKHPEAAEWWRTNCPYVLTKRRTLVFRQDECLPDGE